MMIVAAVGIAVNGVTALLFARGREHDINIRGAFLHMAADAAVSAAVVFAGFVILWTGQQWVDPVMSLAVAVVILWGSIGLLKELVGMSLMGVPSGIDVDQVEAALAAARRRRDGARPPRLAAEHDRNRAHRASRRHRARLTDALLRQRASDAPRPLPHRALHAAGRARPSRRHSLLMTNVTHLECSLTGERYEAGQVHNLQRAGKPLLVRYDLEAAKRTLTRDSLAQRARRACGNGASCCRNDGEPVSLGEPETPIVALAEDGRAPNLLVKDEGRLPTGSFKARGLAMAVTMAKQFGIERIAMPTNGNAGAALAAYGARAGIETIVICPAETPEINVHRDRRLWRARLCRRRPDRRMRRAGREGRGGRACGSTARP